MKADPVVRKTSVETDDRRIAEARRQEIRALATMDELDLANASIMAEAWRSSPLGVNPREQRARRLL